MTLDTEGPAYQTRSILDHGAVTLEAMMGDDLTVVNAAKVSFLKHAHVMTEGEKGILRFLLRERHGSPFEHPTFRFRIRCPIFVARQWFRHRIGSFNEHSERYSEAITDNYLPDMSDIRTQVGKPGAYKFEPLDHDRAWVARRLIQDSLDRSQETYEELLAMGVAKEIARTVLPVATYTEFVWTVNARSLMNFISLRNSEHAQKEIRVYAEVLEEIFGLTMPETAAAFVQYGRKAP